jgi:GNAT superfamily N-acetyltransferase
MIKYQQEFVDDVFNEISYLAKIHWHEIALNKDKVKLNIDWDGYRRLEEDGALSVFTCRSDGKLVGYVITLSSRHIRYRDHVTAVTDLVYLHPDYRSGWTAYKMLKFAESCLKSDGVSVFSIGMKHHSPFDALVIRMGYSPQDITYSKFIGD